MVLSSGKEDCFTRHGPAVQYARHRKTLREFEEVLGGCLYRVSPCALHIAGSGHKQGLTEAIAGRRVFLIHCTRHFIRNLFIFFFLFSSKSHCMSTLGSFQYHFMAMVFKLLVLHSGLETSENINSVHACRI